MSAIKIFFLILVYGAVLCYGHCCHHGPRHHGPHHHRHGQQPRTEDTVLVVQEIHRWPSPDVPLVISSEYDHNSKTDIARGVNMLHESTCVRFVPPRDWRQAHVLVRNGKGCNAVPGYNSRPGFVSVVNLHVPQCTTAVGHVVHELMHVLGFYHEHQRLDRDEHISVQYANIAEGHELNFRKVFNETLGLPYDIGSVMHYGPYGFCKDCTRRTIVAMPGESSSSHMGQRLNLSVIDVAKVNRLYQCTEHYLGDDLPSAQRYQDWVTTRT